MADAPLVLSRLRAVDLERENVRFTDGKYLYTTSGRRLGHGGMGNVWSMARWPAGDGEEDATPEIVVGKTFREEFLVLLREDETARRRFDHFEQVIEEVKAIEHPNVLPVLLVSPIADNYLLVSPLAGESLLALLTTERMSARDRVGLLAEGLRGLAALHDRGIVHRDFTLHNVLTRGERAAVFDFDLAVAPSMLPDEERTYRAYYQGRIAGSPEFSVAPELLDEVLGHEPISARADVYAVGTALFALFTDESLYGEVPDLSTLLYRIAEGVVRRNESRVRFPDGVPGELRPIIERCLQREPALRYADAREVASALEQLELDRSQREEQLRFRSTMGYIYTEVTLSAEQVYQARVDPSVTREELKRAEGMLGRHGYLLEKSLGRVKGHPIFLALPDPQLVGAGRFPEENTYRKIVTAIDVAARLNPQRFVENWLGRIQPILTRVRQGFLTPLYKVSHEKEEQQLLLFSEYIADPRFGTDLEAHDLSLEEAFGLGLIGALSIARLHAHGLAHNNVRARSLVFKGRRDAGRVQPLFLGLVEPSFDPAALEEDVRNLAGMIGGLIRPSRIDALRPEQRAPVDLVRERLERTASGEIRDPAPTIQELHDVLADGLSAIEPNFEIVRAHGGDVEAFADLLVRHSLYNKLYALDVKDD
jgi:serine/threonine protein kinase